MSTMEGLGRGPGTRACRPCSRSTPAIRHHQAPLNRQGSVPPRRGCPGCWQGCWSECKLDPQLQRARNTRLPFYGMELCFYLDSPFHPVAKQYPPPPIITEITCKFWKIQSARDNQEGSLQRQTLSLVQVASGRLRSVQADHRQASVILTSRPPQTDWASFRHVCSSFLGWSRKYSATLSTPLELTAQSLHTNMPSAFYSRFSASMNLQIYLGNLTYIALTHPWSEVTQSISKALWHLS